MEMAQKDSLDSSEKESFFETKKGQFFKPKKTGFFEKLFKKQKRNPSELKIPPAKPGLMKGKVKEIIVDSALEKKFEQQKSLLSKIPKAKIKAAPEDILQAQKPKKDLSAEKSLRKKRAGKKLSLLVIPSKEYLKSVTVISRLASTKYSKILYVSLNELYDNLITTFEENSIDLKSFYFIDAITSTAQTNIEEKENCTFVTSPNALIELSLVITQKIGEMEPDLMIFDSLSTLFIYEKEDISIKFVHSLIGKIKAAGCDAILTSLEEDVSRKAIKDLGMFVDEFLTMSEYQLRNLQIIGDVEQLIPFQNPKEDEIKKEINEIFPQRGQNNFFPDEKQAIMDEVASLKKNLNSLETSRDISRSISALSRRLDNIENIERKPAEVDTSKIQQEIALLSKKIGEINTEKSREESSKILNRLLERFNSKMDEFEQKLEQEQKQILEQEQKIARQENKSRALAKEKEKMKKLLEDKKKSERQVGGLEKKLALLNKSYSLGLISRQAYEKDKNEIERLIKN